LFENHGVAFSSFDEITEGRPTYLSDYCVSVFVGAVVSKKVKTQSVAYLKENLGALSQREIARRLKVGKTAVNRWATELGFHPVKHTADENFFDSWTSDSAYILGFIFADGNIAWNLKKSYWTLTITASEKDKAHLEKLRELLKSTKPLLYSPKTRSYRLTVTSKNLCRKLMCLGVKPRKSLTAVFPKIPRHYLADFIRGVVDGDGNVRYVERKRSPYFEITIASGSKSFCRGLVNTIRKKFGIPAKIRKAKGNTFIIQYSCSRGEKLAYCLYSRNGLFLERKHAPYIKLKEVRTKKQKEKERMKNGGKNVVYVGVGY